MGDADHVAYEDAVAEWDAVEQLGFFLSKKWSIPYLFFIPSGTFVSPVFLPLSSFLSLSFLLFVFGDF